MEVDVAFEDDRRCMYALVAEASLAADVVSFTAREGFSELYSVDVLCRTSADDGTLETSVLGRDVRLVIRHGEARRALHGIAAAISSIHHDLASGTVSYRVEIVPRLWLLGRTRASRIFQDKSVVEIIATILELHGVRHRNALRGKYAPRRYCVQYQESDLAFVERLLGEEGIFFFFEHPSVDADVVERETLVLADTCAAYLPIDGEAFLPVRDVESGALDPEYVYSLQVGVRLQSGAVLMKEYDFERPRLQLIAHAEVEAERRASSTFPASISGTMPAAIAAVRAVANAPVEHTLRVYDHHAEFEGDDIDRNAAAIALETERRRSVRCEGTARSARLGPGRIFELEGHAVASHNQRYVVVAVDHSGHDPALVSMSGGKVPAPYDNRFVCIPADAVFRPERPAPRIQQVVETALVVGPPGEEIYTDHHGRVKVQFHWDLDGRHDEHSSCWMRAMQPWAGSGFGFQFVPRVGTEVVVTFVGGDTDRPLIVGAAYNGDHLPPFALPFQKNLSGIRTQSTPSAEGFNELSFDDTAGAERLHIHAQRDLVEAVGRDHSVAVRGNASRRIDGGAHDEVRGAQATYVHGDQHVTVAQQRVVRVEGSCSEIVRRDRDVAVDGDLRTRVDGLAREDLARSRLEVVNDRHLAVGGSMTTLVGRDEAKRAWVVHVEGTTSLSGSGATEIRSDRGIVLRCGKSEIRIVDDRIELHSPSIVLRSEDASLAMTKKAIRAEAKGEIVIASDKAVDVQVDDAHVYVKSSAAPESLDETAPAPTVITLTDDDGAPIPYQRFLVEDAEGEKGGILDKEGRAEILLEGDATIVFPDLPAVEEA